MNKKRNFIIDLMSSIDERVLSENLNKRFIFWNNRSHHASFRTPLIPIIAIVACFAIVCTSFLLLLPRLFGTDGQKQVPVYQGMTVSNTAPEPSISNDTDSLSLSRNFIDSLSAHVIKAPANAVLASIGVSSPIRTNRDETNAPITSDSTVDASPEISAEKYYAMPNEDIYIHVHISNPDKFEILSFTLNGVKYSAYMFEDGSDLETLILKYNVGDVEGLQSYTIDAIKYVDGEKIKDVRMVGDKTVTVLVGTSDQTLSFNERFEGWDLVISPEWSESFTGEKKFTSLYVYNGENLVESYDPSTTVIRGLPENSTLLLVATYTENGNTITKKSVIKTPKQSEGLSIISGYVAGIGSCSDTVLYINMPVDTEAFMGNSHIEKIYFGSGVTSIGWQAFLSCSALKEVTFAEGLKEINEGAFAYCHSLEGAVLPSSLTKLGDVAFSDCFTLTEIEIPNGVGVLCNKGNNSPIVGCKNLTTVYIKNSKIVIRPGGAHNLFDPETEEYLPTPFGVLFERCLSLKDVYFDGTLEEWNAATSEIPEWCCFEQEITVHCTDGSITITAAFK